MNAALKRLLLVAGVQVEMEISQRMLFFSFSLLKKKKKLRRYNPIVLEVFPLSTKKALMLKPVCKSHR